MDLALNALYIENMHCGKLKRKLARAQQTPKRVANQLKAKYGAQITDLEEEVERLRGVTWIMTNPYAFILYYTNTNGDLLKETFVETSQEAIIDQARSTMINKSSFYRIGGREDLATHSAVLAHEIKQQARKIKDALSSKSKKPTHKIASGDFSVTFLSIDRLRDWAKRNINAQPLAVLRGDFVEDVKDIFGLAP